MAETTEKLAVWLSVFLILSFGLFVVVRSRKDHLRSENLEDFLTARASMGYVTLGWSFFASGIGSWVITGPAQFGFYSGIVSVVAYAFATSIPNFFIAFFGGSMSQIYPNLLSLSDFVYWRFGRATQILTLLINLVNMSAGVIVEYSTLMSLYSDFVGLGNNGAYIVILTAVVTLLYTAYGGLKASIVTDKVQGVVALYLVQVIAIYLSADFNKEDIIENIQERGFNASFEFDDNVKGTTPSGWGTMFTLPLSLVTSKVFSEQLWQRSWAAVDSSVLNKAAILGSVLTFIVIGFFGAMGILAGWAGMVEDPFSLNQNLFAFQVFQSEVGKTAVSSGIGVLIILLGTVMAESAIDSMQNGIGASFNGTLLRYFREHTAKEDLPAVEKKIFSYGRVLLILINCIYVVIGIQKPNVQSVFLVGNMISVCAFLPIALGLLPDKFYTPYLSDFLPVSVFLLSMVTTGIYSAVVFKDFGEGFEFAFWGNTLFEYPNFLCALLASIIWTVVLIWFSIIFLEKKEFQEIEVKNEEDIEKNKVEVEVEISSLKEENVVN
eukprot:snap_masked-scaffold_19-processed-gene-2.31-mRNA-1 protein AED:1.00 eAED:1.00 QI:0/-1/0/0/-1/1/1/0/549